MKRASISLLSLCLCLLWAAPLYAGSDEYLGDSSIYYGVPTTIAQPNVLLSRSTINYASGVEYEPWDLDADGRPTGTANSYPLGYQLDNNGNPTTTLCSESSDNPGKGCYLPFNIYKMDNQGDFSQLVRANTSISLERLNASCNPKVRSYFQEFGMYSGSASTDFPTIGTDGACITSGNNNSGETYALGNYLNYTKMEGGRQTATLLPEDIPDACKLPNTVIKAHEWKNGAWTPNKYAFFRLKVSHTSSSNPERTPYEQEITDPATNKKIPNPELDNWEILPPLPEPASYVTWGTSTTYTTTVDKVVDGETCGTHITEAGGSVTPPTGLKTQREIIYNALAKVITATAGVVRYGAMVYGNNNSGAQVIQSRYDSTFWTDMQFLAEGLEWDEDNPPDCTLDANKNLKVCKFVKALPGPGENDGAPRAASNANRPLAESLYDAGYYYGASYTGITNTRRIPNDQKNLCDLNHIILITNGFSNGDGSPKLKDNIGDFDKDGVNEAVYGLGSHYLDDVAKYLNEKHKIKTHTVLAFQTEDYLIKNAAVEDGGGEFYNVHNAAELAAALRDLLGKIINESSTSFVAPVVPSSTTNRTISSNKVYLGLFRPQQDGPWHGNIKKYSISQSTLQLLGADGTPATDVYGNFLRDSISYWSKDSNGLIPSATTKTGYIDPNSPDANAAKGDGGDVSAGGAGAVLLGKMRGLADAIRSQNTWAPNGHSWRNIYTYLDSGNSTVSTSKLNLYDSQNRFIPENEYITSTTLNYYNGANLRTEAETDNLIRFVHGFIDDEDITLAMTPSTAKVRDWVLGDVLHSKPVVFNYSKYVPSAENQCYAFDGQLNLNANSSVIFAGTNDGMLHAFRDCDGQELWAFIPPNVLPTLQYYKDPKENHATFVDSAPSLLVHDQNNNGTIEPDGGDKVVLVFGQRRGGGTNVLDENSSRGAYYALDVTNPLQPKYLWEVDNAVLGEIGETWSQPRLAKVPVNSTSFKVVAFVGTGYDNNEDLRFGDTQTFPDSTGVDINMAGPGGEVDGSDDPQTSSGDLTADNRNAPRGRGIMAIEVATLSKVNAASPYTIALPSTGTVYWSYTFADNDQLKYSFPGDLAVLDLNGDSYADTIYTGDTGGNLWKFNVGGADKTQWTGQMLFQSNAGADNSNGRKIFYRPEVAYVGAPHIYFGSGDREHPLNRAVVDRMYCVIDWGAQGTYPATEWDLVDATANTLQDPSTTKAEADALLAKMLSSPWAPYQENGVSKFTYGWHINLDGTDRTGNTNVLDLGEKVLAPATVFNGEVFFSTYQLETGARAGCDAGNMGISRLYHLNYRTAEAVMNYNLANDDLLGGGENDGEIPAVNERSIGENGEVFDRTDRTRTLGEGIPSGIVTLIDASGNVTQLISSSDKVEAMAAPDIKLISPVYWMQW